MATPETTKANVNHTENASTINDSTLEHTLTQNIHGFEIDFAALPKGYYYSRFFLGTFLATGLAIICGTAAFGFAAPILGVINADIGPDARYTWISLVYNAVLAVFLSPVGRLSDIFGRRYFFVGGAVVAIIGSVVCATAQDIPTLIGGNVLLAAATATQLSFHFVIGELVPMKHRYFAIGMIYIFTYASSGMGPAISASFVANHPNVGWRGVYWLLFALNVTAFILWTAFYYPPSFSDKHKHDENRSKVYWLKHFDWIGTFLFASGFIVFLMGLSWGGSLYPWKSAAVISAIIIGFVVLVAFVLWEIYAPIKEPLIPMHLFLNGRWVAAVVLLGSGAGVYYAFSIVWPAQAAVLYGNGDTIRVGYMSTIVGISIITGQVLAGIFAERIGKTRYQCMAAFLIGGTFLGCAAVANPDNGSTTMALIFLGCMFIGWNESICLANSTILVEDQNEIGIAGGTAGSVRAAICAVLVAIYSTIMTNRLEETIPAQVSPVLINAGLPAASVPLYLQAIRLGAAALAAVPGITEQIMAVGYRAYQEANADAFRTVYLATIAFSAASVVLTWWAPNTDDLMTGKVAATLNHEGQHGNTQEKHREKKEEKLEEIHRRE
ncbi:MFS general substrate transporter [Cucurbitaria berberidis CBS 394.84]|uniref:MFS general substrate transporter n=1 Tax=Cucurbitaria berberidis CBS 394.84 TaxID=1168544 RepID=A0A9P4L3W0_9PLEO|nr:MFS general substrate transporter [Cucurbitaria berberidis CBS 394.84]KAF1840697.1 MFS general substrate transporter [Cucurbitaria berberidis CBS 394.84]